jgi:hypothetical protein
MPKVELDLETTLPPEKVIAALTDFTDRRPDIWPGLSRNWYEVYSVGDTSADVREGTGGKRSSIWARERYDWSTPGTVTWTVQESGFCTPGSFVSARVDPRDGGGSRIHVTWSRTGTTLMGRVVARIIALTGGKPVAASVRKGLRQLEQAEAGTT